MKMVFATLFLLSLSNIASATKHHVFQISVLNFLKSGAEKRDLESNSKFVFSEDDQILLTDDSQTCR